ncbi:MAG: hypothetical protein M1133_04040 [Armatimonadetes bacterium]|nr:hypothetical protein [Armatimonadota bacterium]
MIRNRTAKFPAVVFLAALALALLVIALVARHRGAAVPELDKPLAHLSSLHMKCKMLLYQQDGRTTSGSSEVWYAAPDKVKIDTVDDKGTQTNISRGDLEVIYSSAGQAAVYSPALPGRVLKSSIRQVTPTKAVNSGGRITGQKTVAGRRCYVLESPISNGAQFSSCIDIKTGVTVAFIHYYDGKRSIETKATSFEPNAQIPGNVFNPTPPKGMPVVRVPFTSSAFQMLQFPVPKASTSLYRAFGLRSVDIRYLRDQSRVSADLLDILRKDQETGTKAKLKGLYAPTFVPLRFQLLKVLTHNVERKTTVDGTTMTRFDNKAYDAVEIDYLDPKTGDALILIEDAIAQKLARAAAAAPGFDGKIIKKSSPFPYSDLTWAKNGVYFRLGAVNVGDAELVKVARSLRAVQK